MNELIDYKIKIKFSSFELECIIKSLILDYSNIVDKAPHLFDNVKDLQIGMKIFSAAKRKLDQRILKYKIEGRPQKVKPFGVGMNKLELLWLYWYIDMAELLELQKIKIAIGQYIIDIIE